MGGVFAQEPHKKQKGKLRGWVEKCGFSPMSEIEVRGTDFSFVLWKCYNSERKPVSFRCFTSTRNKCAKASWACPT